MAKKKKILSALLLHQAVVYNDKTQYVSEEDGKIGLTSTSQGAWGSSYFFIPDDWSKVTTMYGDKISKHPIIYREEPVEYKKLKKGGDVEDFDFTYDKESLKNIIRNEGLLYAVTNFMTEDSIKKSNVQLRNNWAKASNDIQFMQDFMNDRMEEYSPAILIYKDGQYKLIVDPEVGEYREAPVTELPPAMQDSIKDIHNVLMEIVKEVGLDEKDYGAKFHSGGMSGKSGILDFLKKKVTLKDFKI